MSGTIVPAVRIRYRPRRVDDVALLRAPGVVALQGSASSMFKLTPEWILVKDVHQDRGR